MKQKITLNQIKKILKDKVERTLLHSQHIVADTNTFIEKEVQKKLDDISKKQEMMNKLYQLERDKKAKMGERPATHLHDEMM